MIARKLTFVITVTHINIEYIVPSIIGFAIIELACPIYRADHKNQIIFKSLQLTYDDAER